MGTKLCFKQGQFPRLKQLVVDNAPNLDELRFEGGACNLEMLTLSFERQPKEGIIGIETNLPNLKEVEFFGETIVDSLVNGVMAAFKTRPNEPRFCITKTGTSTIVDMEENDVTPTNATDVTPTEDN